MTATLNYIIEANLALLMILTFYLVFLRKETRFRFLRIFLLTGIFASLIFPLIHMEANQQSGSPFSIGQVIPTYWLPEVVIGGGSSAENNAAVNFWKYTTLVYAVGLIIICMMVSIQLRQLLTIIKRAKTYRFQKLRIAESPEDQPTFSFFHFIFIGKADELSASEKKQIIQHESVHARQWHSFDILLMNVLKIFFWFNPFISTYKKIFVQLHEFEADARAVENSDVNKYCSLLAKVALQSADFKLANHFNNSLTVKRIEMMRTIKSNIKRWKLVTLVMMLPLVFFFIACQDQVGDNIMEITKNSSHALIVPTHVQERFDQLKTENPDKNYVLLELNETASDKLESLKKQYGLPKSIEVMKTLNGQAVQHTIRGEAENITLEQKKPAEDVTLKEGDTEIKIGRTDQPVEGEQTFAIIEFNEETNRIVNKMADASQESDVFTVVEQLPEFNGGYDEMMKFIRENMRYPAEARMQGVEGTVYSSFIVEVDGSVSSVNTIHGISEACDSEAKRVIASFPKWIPGKQSGKQVRVRFVMPIKFNLNNK